MKKTDEAVSTAREQSATHSAASFPFRFPPSPRVLGGGFSVAEGTERLMRFYLFHLGLMRVLAGRIMVIAEFEVKIEVGHFLFMHAEAADLLRKRLTELRKSTASLDAAADDAIQEYCCELEQAENTPEFLGGCFLAAVPALLASYKAYSAQTDGLIDQPSIRVLNKIKPDLEAMVLWGRTVLEAFVNGGVAPESFNSWVTHLNAFMSGSGVLACSATTRAEGVEPRTKTRPPFRRPYTAARDARFSTFTGTRDYRKADHLIDSLEGTYLQSVLEMVRVQRDEIDAIETFANVLYDLPDAPFALKLDLARFIWDESRHAEAGQQALAKMGFDPFQIPCGMIGINVRAPLAPEIALAQINIFGELNIIGALKKLARKGYQRGDSLFAPVFDFIHADETNHLRKGRSHLNSFPQYRDLKELQEAARCAAIQRLREEGVLGEDYASDLTEKEISALIGGE